MNLNSRFVATLAFCVPFFWCSAKGATTGWNTPGSNSEHTPGSAVTCAFIEDEFKNGAWLQAPLCQFKLYDGDGEFYENIPTDYVYESEDTRYVFSNKSTSDLVYPEVTATETWALEFWTFWDPGTAVYDKEENRRVIKVKP